jgi:cobalamin biosynthesis protein CbiG
VLDIAKYIVFNFWKQYSIDQFPGITLKDNQPSERNLRSLANSTSKSNQKISQYPQTLWVGLGCKRGSSQQLIETAIHKVFQENLLNENAIAGLATIDTKASDYALLKLCHLHNWQFKTFSAQQLSTVTVPNPAEIITTAVGTPSVAEAAAILGAFRLDFELLLPKYIFRLPGQPGVVTIAVAEEQQEYQEYMD